jgi:hypothetical protein
MATLQDNPVAAESLSPNSMNPVKRTRDSIRITSQFNANPRTEWSSFSEGYPRVIAQTYLFEHPVSALTTTSTRHGITSRDLLVATTQQLIALPKRLLDPRRPVIPQGGKLKGDDKEEGLAPYEPVIPDERKWTISHINEVRTPLSCLDQTNFSYLELQRL